VRRSEADAGGYKQGAVVAGCYTKGATLVARIARILDVALHTQDPAGRIFDQMELRPALYERRIFASRPF
jgi:hypothetical protein